MGIYKLVVSNIKPDNADSIKNFEDKVSQFLEEGYEFASDMVVIEQKEGFVVFQPMVVEEEYIEGVDELEEDVV